MPKKRTFNSTEPFAKKPIFLLRNLKISFVKKCETFRASYETVKGSIQNQYLYGFIAKPLRVSYVALKVSHFFKKLIFKFRSKKIGFLAKGSSRGYTGRTFKGSVELKVHFFGIWIHSEVFPGVWNLFLGGFVKILFLLE